jgi:hypothetical protein
VKKRHLRVVTEHVHPITGLSLDYERCCNTCAHFTDKTRTLRGEKYRTIQCALDPQQRNLDNTPGTTWKALPGCSQHKPQEKNP